MRVAYPRVQAGFLAALFLLLLQAPVSRGLDVADVVPRSAPVELASLPAGANATGVVEDGTPQVRARLLVGEAFGARHVGVLFDLAEGWHLYWRNPGGTGIAPELGLEIPGASLGDIAWPTPLTFVEADGLFTTWGYEGSVLLSVPITSANTTSDGMIEARPEVLLYAQREAASRGITVRFRWTKPIDGDLRLARPGEAPDDWETLHEGKVHVFDFALRLEPRP